MLDRSRPDTLVRLVTPGFVIFLAVSVSLLTGCSPTDESVASAPTELRRPADHVVLISIDGLRPDFYRDSAYTAPTLRRFATEGAQALAVESVFPSVTYPSHTTMITGALPAEHGIDYNSPFEPGGVTGAWYWASDAIRVPTLWDAVAAAGLTTAALNWPVSVGAPVDWLVPEVWSLGEETVPYQAMRETSNPAGLVAEIEAEATGPLTHETFGMSEPDRDLTAGEAAAYLLATYRPNLLLVHLIGTDHWQHEDGISSDRVDHAVEIADRAVARIAAAAEQAGIAERTAFVVTGDHGFFDVHTDMRPNVWLSELGLHPPGDKDRGDDWRAYFHVAAAASFLHLADPTDQEAVDLVRRRLDALPDDQRAHFRIVERDELTKRGAAPEAVLALAPAEGVASRRGGEGPVFQEAARGTHGYLPDMPGMETGFVAHGAGVAEGVEIERMNLTDIAPLIAQLLGLDAFEAPHGRLPAEVVDGD